jgi:hypothetical protein
MAQSPSAPANPGIIAPTQSDPLAQLRDIHLPAAIEAWPPAPGWWGLAFLCAVALSILVYWAWGKWQANKYRREAIRQLDKIAETYDKNGDARVFLHDYQLLLKRVALTHYSRDRVANLTGESWVAFLDESSNSSEFTMGAGQVLIDGNYIENPSIDVSQLYDLGRHWIRKHKKMSLSVGSVEGIEGVASMPS